MEQHQRRRLIRRRPDEAIFKLLIAEIEQAAGRAAPPIQPPRSLKRWILPVAVFGRLSTNSIQRGYFHVPIRPLT